MIIFIIILLLGGVLFFLFTSMRKGSNVDIEERLRRYTMFDSSAEVEIKDLIKEDNIFDKVDKKIQKKDFSQKIAYELAKADLPIRVSEFIAFRLVITTLSILIGFLMMGIIGLFVFGVVGQALPNVYVKMKQKKRQKLFSAQMEDTLSLISNSLKAGYSFLQAVDMVAQEMPPPISVEFNRVKKETTMGMNLEESLNKMARRMESDDFDLVVTSVIIQRQTGGNLSEILDNIANTIRERVKLKGEIMTLTAMGRMSAGFICALPIALSGIFYMINKDAMSLLFTTTTGKIMLAGAVISMFSGVSIIRKIINIEV